MSNLDWAVMLGTLFFITAYGVWKTRGAKDIKAYLLGDNQSKWWTIGLSVMATQASAITFLSTPGQGYEEGMGFIQFYFGLPLAIVIICVVFIPLYYRLKVYTAYEFLESRFDLKTRVLTASLFLLQRGLAAGITIYAPAIILSQILGWDLRFTVIFIGVLVIIYTVSGGTKAVSQTHKQQMFVIFSGMFITFGVLVYYLSEHVTFGEAIDLAGVMGKMNVIDTSFDLNNKYTLWSGLLAGMFLQLSYFGTDHSQVQRYLSGSSIRESRMGLIFNGFVKIPMQFFILLTGVLVFVFYQFQEPPIYFNEAAKERTEQTEFVGEFQELEKDYKELHQAKLATLDNWVASSRAGDELASVEHEEVLKVQSAETKALRKKAAAVVDKADPGTKPPEDDFIFITFVMNFLPVGLIGLLLAVIFSAAMSSTSAELNALASTTTVDIYKRNFKQEASDEHYLKASKFFTAAFGVAAILFALGASLFENLIEAVNILGSLFYGTILGVFIVAFFVKQVGGKAVFYGALMAEFCVIAIYVLNDMGLLHIEYLWLNIIGCFFVVVFSLIIQMLFGGGVHKLK